MRRILIASLVAGVAVLGASVPALADIGARWMVTEAKAERLVIREATVRLAPTEKRALEQELGQQLGHFQALELAAMEERDLTAYSVYGSISARYMQALRSVQLGLGVKHAGCQGTGRSARGSRFERFQCLVTSGVLRIPSVEVDYSAATPLPSVIENEPREVGPLSTQYRVRVTGPSSINYR